MKQSEDACRAIRAAATQGQVLLAIRDYLSSLDSAQAALLPAEVVATIIDRTEEVIHYALHLAHTELLARRDSPRAPMLTDVVKVFEAAAQRLATLAGNGG